MHDSNQDEVCFVLEYEIVILLALEIVNRIPSITAYS